MARYSRNFVYLLSLAFCVLIAWLFFRRFDIDFGDIVALLLDAGMTIWMVLCAINIALFMVTAVKWAMVHSAMNRDDENGLSVVVYLELTLLAGFLAQVLPSQLAQALVRTIGLKILREVKLAAGFKSNVVDVVIDGFVVLGFAVLLGAWLVWQNITLVLLLAPVLAIVLPFALRLFFHLANLAGRRFLAWSPFIPLLERRLFNLVVVLSMARFALFSLRAFLIAALFFPSDVDLWVASVLAIPLALFAGAISFMPGGFGAVEWSLVELLRASGAEAALAANYAIVSRIAMMISVSLTVMLALPLAMLVRQKYGQQGGGRV